MKLGLRRTINWYKFLTKIKTAAQNQYFDDLNNPNFQGVHRFYALVFENVTYRTAHAGYDTPKATITNYNVAIDERNFLDQPVKNDEITYDNIQKITNGQRDDYITDFQLDFRYFK